MDDDAAKSSGKPRRKPDTSRPSPEAEEEWAPDERPRRRKRGRASDELTAEEKDEAARKRARSAGVVLLLGWLLVSAMNAIVLMIAIGRANNPPANPMSFWAPNEMGLIVLWTSAVLVPLGVLGMVSGLLMRRYRGYWLAVLTTMALLLASFPYGVACPALWVLPVTVLLTLANRRVARVSRLAREGGAVSTDLAEPDVAH